MLHQTRSLRIFLAIVLPLGLTQNLRGQNALDFDGIDDKIDCGNHSSLQITGTQITLEAWIYATAWKPNVWEGNIINKEENAPDRGYMLRAGDGGKLNLNIGNGSWNEITTFNSVLNLNQWHHVAGTYDGSYLRLYVDGAIVDSLASSINFSNSAVNLFIGGHATMIRHFQGAIDEVRVWSVARTSSEIASSMNSEFCGPQTGLEAYYRFNQGTAGGVNTGLTTLNDAQGNNDGTLLNFALNGSSSNWISGATLAGSSQTINVTDSICDGDLYSFGGLLLDSAGQYSDTIMGSSGCDSIVNLNLLVRQADLSVSQNAASLTSNATNAGYQWINCSDSSMINGATNASFVASWAGSFAVIVTQNGCTDTSDCYTVNAADIGIAEVLKPSLGIYPNPVDQYAEITTEGVKGNSVLRVYDIRGQQIRQTKITQAKSFKLDVTDLDGGIYIVELENSGYRTQEILVRR